MSIMWMVNGIALGEMSLPWCGSGDFLAGISGVAATDQLLGQK